MASSTPYWPARAWQSQASTPRSPRLYHDLNRAEALALAGVIALTSIAVALVIDAEPVALFGVGVAMVTPAAVAHEVTSAGIDWTLPEL